MLYGQKGRSFGTFTLRQSRCRSIWVKDFQAIVENGKIAKYRLNAKISFLVRDEKRQALPAE